jgi:hypothetical protein
MKTIHYLLTGIMMMASSLNQAQNTVNPDFSLEAQAILESGNTLDIRYYYYPNLQAYFDTHTSTYIYTQNGEWIEGSEIPSGFRGYSMYNTKRVAIEDYEGDTPFEFFAEHKKQFPANHYSKRLPPAKQVKEDKSIAYK